MPMLKFSRVSRGIFQGDGGRFLLGGSKGEWKLLELTGPNLTQIVGETTHKSKAAAIEAASELKTRTAPPIESSPFVTRQRDAAAQVDAEDAASRPPPGVSRTNWRNTLNALATEFGGAQALAIAVASKFSGETNDANARERQIAIVRRNEGKLSKSQVRALGEFDRLVPEPQGSSRVVDASFQFTINDENFTTDAETLEVIRSLFPTAMTEDTSALQAVMELGLSQGRIKRAGPQGTPLRITPTIGKRIQPTGLVRGKGRDRGGGRPSLVK